MKKIIYVVVVIVVLIGGGAFYGGMKYAQGQGGRGNLANLTLEQRQQLTANGGTGFTGGISQGRGGMMGGLITGEIISKDDKSITIKMRDGGSKIIFYSNSTGVEKFITGTASDLEEGKNVSINGTTNQDGSVTAQSIQLR